MYRVYDTEKKEWILENVYLSLDDTLYILEKGLFGKTKLTKEEDDRYVVHKSIMLRDKNEVKVYEGDYIKAQVSEEKEVIGIVAYATELSSYIILCVDSNEFYTLGSEVCEYIEVVGNVFDGFKEEYQNGKQALQESEE